MLIEERLRKIRKIIEENKSASIEALVSQLGVSKDTVRRDLIRLEQDNIIRRTHGGAVINNRDALIFDYSQRSGTLSPIKARIAAKAAELVEEGSSVIFDASTTVEATIPLLVGRQILALTNSLTNAGALARHKTGEVKVLPGALHPEQLFLSGSETVQKLTEYHVDYLLLGVFAISPQGVFIHTEAEGLVKRQMVMQSRTVIALADHTKIDTTGFFKVCDLSLIDFLITDVCPDDSFIQALRENDVELILTTT